MAPISFRGTEQNRTRFYARFQVLPALFPDTFGAPNSCVPLPVHAGYSCALCEMAPIEGPRFEENGSNFCAECFVIKSLQGKTEAGSGHRGGKLGARNHSRTAARLFCLVQAYAESGGGLSK